MSSIHRWTVGVVGLSIAIASHVSDLRAEEPPPPPSATSEGTPAATSDADEQHSCLPACRSGYTCVRGSCVSECNPPCEPGQMCVEGAQCVEREPARAAEPAGPPPATTPANARSERSGVVPVLRVGFMLTGSGEGEVEIDCSPASLCANASSSGDYDDASTFMLEGDVLFHVTPTVRLGLGVMVVPSLEIEPEDESTSNEAGTELVPLAIVEGVFGADVAASVRVFGGPEILIAGGDLEEGLQGAEASCTALEASAAAAGNTASCNVSDDPFFGYTLGGGVGVVGQVDPAVALRADLTVQYVHLGLASTEQSIGSDRIEASTSLSGTRLWLTAGLEF